MARQGAGLLPAVQRPILVITRELSVCLARPTLRHLGASVGSGGQE